jgi:hypothetical protein
MKRTDTGEFLTWFTLREEELLAQARERQLILPERLQNWRLWIQDPTLYLHELASFVQAPKDAPAELERTARPPSGSP